jgi:hypothetical protein
MKRYALIIYVGDCVLARVDQSRGGERQKSQPDYPPASHPTNLTPIALGAPKQTDNNRVWPPKSELVFIRRLLEHSRFAAYSGVDLTSGPECRELAFKSTHPRKLCDRLQLEFK